MSGGYFDSGGGATPEPQHNFRVTEGSATLTADGAWVDITSYTNSEGEDDSGESTQYYSAISPTTGEVTFLESGTLFFLYLTAVFTNGDTPSGTSDVYGVDIELQKNGSTTVLSLASTVLKGLGINGFGTYAAGEAFSASDTLKARARVSTGSVNVSLDRIDWGIRWIE